MLQNSKRSKVVNSECELHCLRSWFHEKNIRSSPWSQFGNYSWICMFWWYKKIYSLVFLGVELGLASTKDSCRCLWARWYSWVTLNIKPKRRWTSLARWKPGATYKSCWNAFTDLKVMFLFILVINFNDCYSFYYFQTAQNVNLEEITLSAVHFTVFWSR